MARCALRGGGGLPAARPELTLVGLLLKLGGRRVVYDVHEHVPYQILDKDWIPRRLRPLVAWLYDHYERAIVGYFDCDYCRL